MPLDQKELIEVLAESLVGVQGWPATLAAQAAEAFIHMHINHPEEFNRYEKLTREAQLDLWFYFATGWNQGRLFARLATN